MVEVFLHFWMNFLLPLLRDLQSQDVSKIAFDLPLNVKCRKQHAAQDNEASVSKQLATFCSVSTCARLTCAARKGEKGQRSCSRPVSLHRISGKIRSCDVWRQGASKSRGNHSPDREIFCQLFVCMITKSSSLCKAQGRC